jgi:hypothetical protein
MNLRSGGINLQGACCTENVLVSKAVRSLKLVCFCETDLTSVGCEEGKMARF